MKFDNRMQLNVYTGSWGKWYILVDITKKTKPSLYAGESLEDALKAAEDHPYTLFDYWREEKCSK